MDLGDRKRLADRRQRHKEEGLCAACDRYAAPDRTLCDFHLFYHRQLKREKRSKAKKTGNCIHCFLRPAKTDRFSCDPCLIKKSERYYQQRQEALTQGKCVFCKREDAEEESTFCTDCKEHVRDLKAQRKVKKAEREQEQACH